MNEECDLVFSFENTFKTDNYILFIASRANGMISQMVRNFISEEINVDIQNSNKTSSCTQIWVLVSKHGN